MGQVWFKNQMTYPTVYPDEQMKDIPYPRLELHEHVLNKFTQMTTGAGMLVLGPVVALVRKQPLIATALRFGRRGFLFGIPLAPVMTEGVLYGTKSGPEQVYDRVYRIRYNNSQVRSAQWSGYGFLGGAAVGVAFASPPTTKLLGAANGALVGYLIGTVESAAVPQDWIGRASTGAPKKAESKEEKAAEK